VHGLPDPALILLVGASGSGKSTWAQEHYRGQEIVSSDDLRGVVGSGRHDLDASADAFRLLDDIVAARTKRGLTVVIDTLGLDVARRRGYREVAAHAGLPAVAVVFDAEPRVVRERNARRDRPVPAQVLRAQLAKTADVADELRAEGWDDVVVLAGAGETSTAAQQVVSLPEQRSTGLEFVLQISRFPWGEDPAAWLTAQALAAEAAGFSGIALMDHLIQIPQVDREWAPIPEPWVTLGLLAGLDTRLRLGTLVSPVSFRAPGVTAKVVATLDVLSRGRAFLGIGAGWWEREHAGFGLPFPPAAQRLDDLERAVELIRALWAPGTKAYVGERATLPETTCYPRPVSPVPIIVGGSGERRTLRIAARLGDGCNVGSAQATLQRKIDVLHRHCRDVGRDPDEVQLTVLDLPVVGADRDEVWARVERLRGRARAAAYAASHHAGTYAEQRERYRRLAELGVRTVFVAPPHVGGAEDVLALAPMIRP
jgi:alkanesulfonate monooxygenase SsuD/methylene tetrahydromethanopterin reductase-like flavin-dependent oxidoreductase (luciferase family)/predicted kinase